MAWFGLTRAVFFVLAGMVSAMRIMADERAEKRRAQASTLSEPSVPAQDEPRQDPNTIM